MDDDATWLREYAENGSDRAFSALVQRYFNLVYSAALRLGQGDAALAQDVAQSVFTDFACKARSLPRDVLLGGWLYKHTCFAAASAIRKERRRQARERQAFEMNTDTGESDTVWTKVAPLMDHALGRLGDSDRHAVVLRFFEQRSFKSVGGALGISEEAARKRVDRALDKLRVFFGQRGLSFSAAVLTAALDAHAGASAPAGMASAVASAALAHAAHGGGAGLSLFMAMTKTHLTLAAAVAGLATAVVLQSQSNTRLQRQNADLRHQAAQLDQLRADNERLAARPAAPQLGQEQFRELLRLRGEAGTLKGQLTAAKKALAAAAANSPRESAPPSASESQDGPAQQAAVAKISYAKQWMLAFILYAGDHQSACPTNFEQAALYWPKDASETSLTTNQFKVFYPGAFNEITNPSGTIIVGETEPVQGPYGGWFKTYGFADGHSEMHKEADGNFAPWENLHTQIPSEK
ncbi:MAG TPA: sigma-70 family RNA polymerase sigma factor [Verrucomicrobiae bacterium]|jgi:RNA polymerase sigma factor (sigma-70 family)